MTIRVLHIITTLGRGGAERQLVNLACNTDGAEFTHTICYLRPPSDFAPELKAAGREVINLNLPRKVPWIYAPARLVPILRENDPHIIQTWLFEADLAARLSTLTRSIPIINTLHLTSYEPGTIAAGNWPPRKVEVLRQIDRLTSRWSRPLFIAVSEAVKKSAMRNLGLPDENVRVIYNSIDQTTLNCEPDEVRRLREEMRIPADAFVFINVGRLAPQKGQSIALKAFQLVAAELSNTYLVLVGEGPEAEALEALARELNITDRVRFMGRRTDVGACLEMSNVFIFPSLFEGFPLAPIEAMLKGVPCIAASIEPVLELFADGETGVLVEPGSERGMAAAMMKLYAQPDLRQRLSANARALAMERFDSSTGLRAWEQLYRELAPRRVRHTAGGTTESQVAVPPIDN